MVYVPGYKHDIFISYARENNEPDPYDIRWVTDFQLHLNRELGNLLAGKPDVYFDSRNYEAGNELDDLLIHAQKSALLVVILSPVYLQPGKFTLKELQAFCEAASPYNRIVLVELIPTERSLFPAALHSPKPMQFYGTDEATNTPERLTRRFNSELYVKRMTQIAAHIAKRLNEMRAGKAPAETQPGPPPPGGKMAKTVLLAKCTDDLVDEPNEVRTYLEQFGIKVLPEGDYPVWGTDFVDQYKTDLERADLVVQLLSSVRSERNGENEPSCGAFQYDAAKKAGRQVLQWQHPEIENKLAKLQHYDVEFLRSAPDVRRIGLEQFKREIKEVLSRPAAKPAAETGKLPNVFIAAARNDLDRAIKLREKFKSEDCVASVLATELKQTSPQAIRKDFHDKVGVSNAVVFLYGEASVEFVDQWMFEYLKYHTPGRERIEAIYHAPPPPGLPLDSDWPNLMSVGSRDDFTLSDVSKIVAGLRREVQ